MITDLKVVKMQLYIETIVLIGVWGNLILQSYWFYYTEIKHKDRSKH